MSTDKTLADVQPGGRVRLGNVRDRVMGECEQWFDTSDVDMEAATDSIIAAAQPSPGGQRDDSPMAKMAAALRGKAEAERAAFDQRVQSGEWGPMPDNPDVLELPPLPEEVDSVRCMIRGEKGFAEPCDYYFTSKQMRDYARTALAASQPVSETDAYQQGFRDGQDRTCTVVARQPVGEPLGEVFWDNETGEISVNWLNGDLPPGIGTLLYDAPPAQAVDLGQFRDLAQRWADKADLAPSPMTARSCSQQLLALIDSKAVGK
ncbi:hypothetical protein JY442_03475 [Stenotrophomonas maltophilia]|nr:hypothetical protein [Stenotrophomonas maltophilia]